MKRFGWYVGLLFLLLTSVTAHDGPDPIAHYDFHSKFHRGGELIALRGPSLAIGPTPSFSVLGSAEGLQLGGQRILPLAKGAEAFQLTRHFTLAAWVSIAEPTEWGGIIGHLQDDGPVEKGWLLGYRNQQFCIAIATKGADDGDGAMTYLAAPEPFKLNTYTHLAATYDGELLRLFINGKAVAETGDQSGDLLPAPASSLVVGGYNDPNEQHPMRGTLRSISVYGAAAEPAWIAEEFAHNRTLADTEVPLPPVEAAFVVRPYLQFGTTNAMTVMWECTAPTKGVLRYGTTAELGSELKSEGLATIHELRITNLPPEQQMFYQCVSTYDDGRSMESEIRTFQTASRADTPFAFAVISDTQGNPSVSAVFAAMAWEQRPNFLLHPGDLVSTGGVKAQWVHHFFASMEPLVSRVPFYPVLGNHEQNAANYYDYVSLPSPEYYYTFHYGNAQFFMLDTNKKVAPGSEQHTWLDQQLAASTATWKIVCHHHPIYSSDENDYGNLWKGSTSNRGDKRVREALMPLYDKHAVDIVWNGHIHSYERTWQVREGRAVTHGGTQYMITGGGGGHLETPGPYRNFFENTVQRGHHYCMVYVNGTVLEMKAYDLDGRLFDTLKIEKK